MQDIVREIDIFEVTFETHAPTFLVTVGMVADGVSGVHDHAVQVRVLLGVFAEAEKRSFGVVLGQLVENPLGNAGRGAVVERQINPVAFGHRPDQRRKQASYEFRRSYVHGPLYPDKAYRRIRDTVKKRYFILHGAGRNLRKIFAK